MVVSNGVIGKSSLKGPYKTISSLAVSNGVIILPTSVRNEVHSRPLLSDIAGLKANSGFKPPKMLQTLQDAVEGDILLLEIPSGNPEPPTILVVNKQHAKLDLYNSIASQLFLRTLNGPVVWLPRKWIQGR